MQVSHPTSPAQKAIGLALERIERRLRLNRTLYQATLVAGFVLLLLLTSRGLRWLGDALPAASALLVLLAILAAVALLSLLIASALGQRLTRARAAVEADGRAGLKDELTSACWFMQALPGSVWAAAQLERAARTAAGLQPARLIPLRVPAPALGALGVAAVVLAALWSAPPLAPARSLAAAAGVFSPADQEQLRALRALADALPDSEAARKLEAALQTLEQGDTSAEERSQALAQGDAQQAAEMLARMQPQRASPKGDKPSAPEPVAGGAVEKSLEQALLEASEATGAQPQAVSAEAMQEAVDRLNEIARELAASNYVNEAWQKVRGPQIDVAQHTALTASRFAEQTVADSLPSPATGETPMGGGSMFRSAAVAEGKGRTEQEGGTRAGDALGDSPPDPLLGEGGERLEAQLKQAGLSGPEAESEDDGEAWFYAESREQKAFASWRSIQARTGFAQAEAGTNEGISIQHRQIVKDYFINLREGPR
jgi:hypothetical protein